jgi:hypothetical protein
LFFILAAPHFDYFLRSFAIYSISIFWAWRLANMNCNKSKRRRPWIGYERKHSLRQQWPNPGHLKKCGASVGLVLMDSRRRAGTGDGLEQIGQHHDEDRNPYQHPFWSGGGLSHPRTAGFISRIQSP